MAPWSSCRRGRRSPRGRIASHALTFPWRKSLEQGSQRGPRAEEVLRLATGGFAFCIPPEGTRPCDRLARQFGCCSAHRPEPPNPLLHGMSAHAVSRNRCGTTEAVYRTWRDARRGEAAHERLLFLTGCHGNRLATSTSHQPPATSHQPPATSHQAPATSPAVHMGRGVVGLRGLILVRNRVRCPLSYPWNSANRSCVLPLYPFTRLVPVIPTLSYYLEDYTKATMCTCLCAKYFPR